MLTQGTPFTWYFEDDESRKDISIFRNIYGKFCLCVRITHNPRHFTVQTLSTHDSLEAAVAASESHWVQRGLEGGRYGCPLVPQQIQWRKKSPTHQSNSESG